MPVALRSVMRGLASEIILAAMPPARLSSATIPMKSLLLPAIVAAAALLPFQKSEAAKFGGFRVGYKFTLKVDKVVSTKITGFLGTPTNAPIPKSIPKYSRGNNIPFEIIRGGALKTSKFSVPFSSDAGTSNVYNKVITGTNPKTDTAIIYKSSTSKATAGALTFVRISGSAFNLTTNTVTYTLKKP